MCGMLQRLENQAPKDPLDGTRLLVVSVCEAAGLPKNKIGHCFHCFPIYFP